MTTAREEIIFKSVDKICLACGEAESKKMGGLLTVDPYRFGM
jgi:hypothetical protein